MDQIGGRAGRRELGVVGDILPEEAEILGGEGRAVGPFLALAQMEGEDPPVLDIEAFEDVGDELVLGVIADQLRIAIGHEIARVLGRGHQHGELAAVIARHLPRPLEAGDVGIVGQALGDRRQLAVLDLALEVGHLLIDRHLGARRGRQRTAEPSREGRAGRRQARSSAASCRDQRLGGAHEMPVADIDQPGALGLVDGEGRRPGGRAGRPCLPSACRRRGGSRDWAPARRPAAPWYRDAAGCGTARRGAPARRCARRTSPRCGRRCSRPPPDCAR